MNLKLTMENKRGSYIVEASIILPMFIVAVLSLILIVNIIKCSEELTFEAAEDAYSMQNTTIREYISIDSGDEFEVDFPFGIGGRIDFDFGLLIRGYNGTYQYADTLSVRDFESTEKSEVVTVFPKYGEKYHYDGCRYLNQDFRGDEYKIKLEKNDAVNKGYEACKVCGG